MRKIDILDKNYKKAALDVVVYENKTLRDIFENGDAFDVDPPQNKYDYWQRIYNYLAFGTKEDGYLYAPNGANKFDVAYVNKTIDDPIAELNGHTLREVFEDGNLVTQELLGYISQNGYMIENSYYEKDTTAEHYAEVKITTGISNNDNLYIVYNYENLSNRWIDFYVFNLGGIYDNVKLGASNDINKLLGIKYQLPSDIGTTKDLRIRYSPKISQYSSTIYLGELDYKVYDIYLPKVYNLDALGIDITTDMDYYYSLYQARKNITKKTLTYANIFEDLQLFENNYFDEHIGHWINVWANQYSTLTWENGYAKNTQVQGFIGNGISQLKAIIGDTYYTRFKMKTSFQADYMATHQYSSVAGIPSDQKVYNPVVNTWYECSFINTAGVNEIKLIAYASSSIPVGETVITDEAFAINLRHFDESITKEQLDSMLSYYLQIKNTVIYFELFKVEEPIGLGSKFKMLTSGKYTYGHEMDFEDITLKIHFGINFNAYEGYNLLRQFLADNKGVIEYDWGKGSRYADVRLLRAPKTEKDSLNLLTNKWQFKHEEPWYILHEETGTTGIIITNTHEKVIKPKIEFTASSSGVTIELDNGPIEVIDFDFSGVTLPATVIIDPEENTITFADGTNAYGYLNLSYNSFFEIPGDGDNYTLSISGATSMKVTWKEWVVD